MLRTVYSLLFSLATPLLLIRLLLRSRRAPAYRQRMAERFGLGLSPALSRLLATREDQPLLCVHAVSVGETVAAKPLIDALLNSDPSLRCLITTMTPTGADRPCIGTALVVERC